MKLEYNRIIDSTLLKADTLPHEIDALCADAHKYQFYAVCVNPSYVRYAKNILKGTGVKLCTVVGFLLGQTTQRQKVYETKIAIKEGADEIDMVMNIAEFKKRCACVISEIRAVKKVCGKRTLKVIIETALLNQDEIRDAVNVCIDGNADFVKTSTGFSMRGASLEDITIMREASGNLIKIKASGGVQTAQQFLDFFNAGVSRIGTSNAVKIMEELHKLESHEHR
ncbi:2-deoxyribose-5-phosphate aldolase [Mycoplasmoides pneumoniae]|uniref:deoxyribose-phosphate aldolase n=1 Tax=Mycoplasmoides pneumoniae TaxID=2104 RepID=UPI00071B435B|nr:deoxyribose-phosphate aldolase [Mycoplasmoides pneumoniae]AMF84210.1 2-deoxyribose-5-phosphate aldolase [Mycoplasmoides pneumoniae]